MLEVALRVCNDCGLKATTQDDLNLFAIDYTMKHNRQNLCKNCNNKRQYNRCEETRLNTYYKKSYGITYSDVMTMRDKQQNKCKLCGRIEGNTNLTRLIVDHNHDNGQVRGLLCGKCNTALGHLGDDVTVLKRAILYIKEDGNIT